MQYTYGTAVTIPDTAALPPASLDAMIRRGLNHYFGNEQSAKVTAFKDKFTKENPGTEASPEAIAAFQAEIIGAALEALNSGNVGTSVRGPRVEPQEAAELAIAKREVTDILRANGIKPPKGDEAVQFADGTTKTMAQMVAKRRENFGDRIAKEAAKVIAEQRRKADKAKAEAAAITDPKAKTADALGL